MKKEYSKFQSKIKITQKHLKNSPIKDIITK